MVRLLIRRHDNHRVGQQETTESQKRMLWQRGDIVAAVGNNGTFGVKAETSDAFYRLNLPNISPATIRDALDDVRELVGTGLETRLVARRLKRIDFTDFASRLSSQQRAEVQATGNLTLNISADTLIREVLIGRSGDPT